MADSIKILGVRFRAICQATEVEERVVKALAFASGSEQIETIKAENHFGGPLLICQAKLERSKEISVFIDRLTDSGILSGMEKEADVRTDDVCVFHFRLDKQKALLEELALAENQDVIDVGIKVGAYPARRDIAISFVKQWLSGL